VVKEQNSLGSFAYAYVGESAKIQQVDNPNGQRFTFAYYGDAGSRRLQENLQTHVGGSPSDFAARYDYGYNAVGGITAWSQQDPTIRRNSVGTLDMIMLTNSAL
jgi:hypothetical protein